MKDGVQNFSFIFPGKKSSKKGASAKAKPKSLRHDIKNFDPEDCYEKKSNFSLRDLLKEPTWKNALKPVFEDNNVKQLEDLLAQDYAENLEIFPPQNLIFRAFELTPIKQVHA